MKVIVKVVVFLCLTVLFHLFQPEAQAAQGDFLFKWGLPHPLDFPNSVGIDAAGNAYITEAYRIKVIDKDGNGETPMLSTLSTSPSPATARSLPESLPSETPTLTPRAAS